MQISEQLWPFLFLMPNEGCKIFYSVLHFSQTYILADGASRNIEGIRQLSQRHAGKRTLHSWQPLKGPSENAQRVSKFLWVKIWIFPLRVYFIVWPLDLRSFPRVSYYNVQTMESILYPFSSNVALRLIFRKVKNPRDLFWFKNIRGSLSFFLYLIAPYTVQPHLSLVRQFF